jgi:hypothetical protein
MIVKYKYKSLLRGSGGNTQNKGLQYPYSEAQNAKYDAPLVKG